MFKVFRLLIDACKSRRTKVEIIVFGLLAFALMFLVGYSRNLNRRLGISENNEIALRFENDSIRCQSAVYEMTAKQLSQANDSISLKLNETLKELGVQKKRLSQVQYIETMTEVHDSIVFRDTVFREGVMIDTTLTDGKWYSIGLRMAYPDTLEVSPSFTDECYVITERRRLTVDTPKKFFLARLFQKRKTIEVSTVYSRNPYTEVKENRTVKIIK